MYTTLYCLDIMWVKVVLLKRSVSIIKNIHCKTKNFTEIFRCYLLLWETFYSESDVKQVDVSSIVLGFGISTLSCSLHSSKLCFERDLLPCTLKMVLTDILVST